MLRQQTDESDALPAGRVRVTPEELAAALAALEARKQGASGTIAIGDAVDELSLDNTPNDILREVETQREQRARTRKRRRRSWLGFAAALVALGVGTGELLSHTHHRPAITTVAPQTSPLADVGDEQPVYVDTHGLQQIIEGTMPAQVQTYPFSQGIRWGLIKHGGKVYVQAYTLRASEKQIENKAIDLHNVEDADLTGRAPGYIAVSSGTRYPDVKVTLPIQAFRYQDSQQSENQAKITVSDVHPDNHLWDKFEHDR